MSEKKIGGENSYSDRSKCRMCGTTENLERHHLKPKSQGGTDDDFNIIFMCKKCHNQLTEHSGTRNHKRVSTNPVSSFYMGANKWAWREFVEITRREGENASTKLTQFILNYVSMHGPGNPQTLMSSFGEGGDQTVATVEGRVRQLCVERYHKSGSLVWGYIVSLVKDHGISDAKSRVAMGHRVRDWLRGRDIPVYS